MGRPLINIEKPLDQMRRKLRPALLLVVAALFALGTVASLGAAATAGGHGRRLQEGMGRDSFCDFLGADMISCGYIPMDRV